MYNEASNHRSAQALFNLGFMHQACVGAAWGGKLWDADRQQNVWFRQGWLGVEHRVGINPQRADAARSACHEPPTTPGVQFGAGLPKDHFLAKRFYDRWGGQSEGTRQHCPASRRR